MYVPCRTVRSVNVEISLLLPSFLHSFLRVADPIRSFSVTDNSCLSMYTRKVDTDRGIIYIYIYDGIFEASYTECAARVADRVGGRPFSTSDRLEREV